jgi:hypothetical protein
MARKTAKKASAKKVTKTPPSKISRAEYDKRINDFIRLGQLKDAQEQRDQKR